MQPWVHHAKNIPFGNKIAGVSAFSRRRMAEIRLPASGRIGFLRLLVFNFLIGNCDAHAKNYAVLYRDGHPSFAPDSTLV